MINSGNLFTKPNTFLKLLYFANTLARQLDLVAMEEHTQFLSIAPANFYLFC